jgi:hypothetical protein
VDAGHRTLAVFATPWTWPLPKLKGGACRHTSAELPSRSSSRATRHPRPRTPRRVAVVVHEAPAASGSAGPRTSGRQDRRGPPVAAGAEVRGGDLRQTGGDGDEHLGVGARCTGQHGVDFERGSRRSTWAAPWLRQSNPDRFSRFTSGRPHLQVGLYSMYLLKWRTTWSDEAFGARVGSAVWSTSGSSRSRGAGSITSDLRRLCGARTTTLASRSFDSFAAWMRSMPATSPPRKDHTRLGSYSPTPAATS